MSAERTPGFVVESRNLAGQVTAIGHAGPFTVVIDRPRGVGGGGMGFNGAQLLYLSVAGCISNDLFREAAKRGITLSLVRVRVTGDFTGEPAVSTDIDYEVEIEGEASEADLRALVEEVDRIGEIPNTLRRPTRVRLGSTTVRSTS